MFKKIKNILFFFESTNLFWELRSVAQSRGGTSLMAKLLYYLIESKNNANIPLCTEFADKPIFPHGIKGVLISEGAKIGSNVVIFHQVTIGSNTLTDSTKYGAPIIGDNVYIGCGAKIIGKVKVGNNVRIGANCVVCEDIPDNSTVVLPKPRIIKKLEAQDNRFKCLEKNR